MERTEISTNLVMLRSDSGITDTRNGQTYSEVVCRKRDERSFSENTAANV